MADYGTNLAGSADETEQQKANRQLSGAFGGLSKNTQNQSMQQALQQRKENTDPYKAANDFFKKRQQEGQQGGSGS